MNGEKYIGLDVHQATIVVAVLDSTGKLVMESILETEAATILQFFAGLRGTLSVTFEEGPWSVWLYDLLNPHVDKLVVCNSRKNALLKDGNKSDVTNGLYYGTRIQSGLRHSFAQIFQLIMTSAESFGNKLRGAAASIAVATNSDWFQVQNFRWHKVPR